MATEMTDESGITPTSRALTEMADATEELRAVRDRLATVLYHQEMESHWLVPPMHRPTCPLDNKPCTSWTCLVDVCVDAKREG
jgi:hypothetical protein